MVAVWVDADTSILMHQAARALSPLVCVGVCTDMCVYVKVCAWAYAYVSVCVHAWLNAHARVCLCLFSQTRPFLFWPW